MITVTRALEEALLQHFIYKKVEIAYAICKPFPFFESLRDKSFITNRMYQESLEACSNLVPVSRVVHNILTKLEKTFSLSLLMTLFSQINLHEYPKLEMILQSFKDVGATYGEYRRDTPILLEVPTGSAQGCSLQMLPPPPPSYPPHGPRGSEPGASLQQREAPSSSDPAVCLPGFIQEGSSAAVTEDNLTSKKNEEEDPQETPSPAPNIVHVSRDKLIPEIKHEEEPQEIPHTPPGSMQGKKRKRTTCSSQKKRYKKRSSRGAPSPGHGTQEKLQVVDQVTQRKDSSTCNLKVMTKAQKATTKCAQTSRSKEKKRERSSLSSPKIRQQKRLQRGETSPGHGIKEKLQVVDKETQRKDDSACNSKIMTRAQKARIECAQMSRSKEKPQDDTMDFQHPIPVTCGNVKGILYVEKMKLGASKFIQNEEGVWLTAKEFELEGKGRTTKDWKKNVYYKGKSLRQLQKEGNLL